MFFLLSTVDDFIIYVQSFFFFFSFFFVCVALVICGVLGSPFTWPRTLLGWYKSNNRVSLWVSWIILGKVRAWTHYYKWFLNMFHFFFAIQILSFLSCSHDVAKESIFYSYTRHINGFAATLDDQVAAEIASKKSAVSFLAPCYILSFFSLYLILCIYIYIYIYNLYK